MPVTESETAQVLDIQTNRDRLYVILNLIDGVTTPAPMRSDISAKKGMEVIGMVMVTGTSGTG